MQLAILGQLDASKHLHHQASLQSVQSHGFGSSAVKIKPMIEAGYLIAVSCRLGLDLT